MIQVSPELIRDGLPELDEDGLPPEGFSLGLYVGCVADHHRSEFSPNLGEVVIIAFLGSSQYGPIFMVEEVGGASYTEAPLQMLTNIRLPDASTPEKREYPQPKAVNVQLGFARKRG